MRILTFFASFAALLAAAYLLLTLWGWDRFWEKVVGPADLGRVTFAGLKKTPKPNQAIAAPIKLLDDAQIDLPAPVYKLPPSELISAIELAIEKIGSGERVDANDDPLYRRYVFRSKWMRFPDTMDIQVMARDDGGSEFALYSRSQLGHSDFGVNLKRAQHLLKLLERNNR